MRTPSTPSTNTVEGSEGYKGGARAKASDQLPRAAEPISLTWDDDDHRQQFAESLKRKIQAGIDAKRDFDDDVRTYRLQYEGDKADTKREGFANIHVPVTRSMVNTLVAHEYKTLCGVSPMFQVTTSDPASQGAVPAIQSAMESIVVGDLGIKKLLRESLHRAAIDRTAILLLQWETVVEKKRDWEEVTPELIAELEGASEISHKANKKLFDQWDAYSARIARDLEDYERTMTLYTVAKRLDPTLEPPPEPVPPDPLWFAVFREKLTRDAPVMKRVDVLDFGMYPADARTLTEANVSFARDWLTKGALNAGVLSGRFDDKAVAELTERASGSEARNSEGAGGDQDSFESAGLRTDSEVADDEKPYEVFTCLVRWDCDDDGQDELCLVEIELNRAIILRAELYPYWHDRPFFIPINVVDRPGHFYGYSVCKILEDHQAEANTFHNQRADAATLTINAPLVAQSGLKKQLDGQYISPRKILFAESPKEAIQRIDLSSDTLPTAEMERDANAMAQDVVGINATTQGQTNGDGTTMGEIERALQSVNVKMDFAIDSLRDQISEIPIQVLGLMTQYQPGDYRYTTVGADGKTVFGQITRAQMEHDVAFQVHGTSALANAALQYQKAEKAVLWAERSPFVQADLTRRYAVDRYYAVQGLGLPDGVWQEIIGTPEQAAQMQAAAQNAPPPPPEVKISESRRIDEVQTLAIALKEGTFTEEEYLAAAITAKAANAVLGQIIPGTPEEAATDQAAGARAKPAATASTAKKTPARTQTKGRA